MMDSLLPPNATSLERAIETRSAGIDDLHVINDRLWDPETCPVAFLPWLAWSMSVDVWNPHWPEATKRQVIAESFTVHRHKGTLGAVRRALNAMGVGNIDIVEWFNQTPVGAPYTFAASVALFDRGLDADEQRAIIDTINRTKNARSHLSNLTISQGIQGNLPAMALSLSTGTTIDLFPVAPAQITLDSAPIVCMAIHAVHTINLDLEGIAP